MARTRPEGRLDDLVAAAADVFARNGYRRTQMADVARNLGVAAGTLYAYVEGKEALFDLVVQRAFVDDPPPAPALPVRTPSPDELLGHVRRRLGRRGQFRALTDALAKPGARPTDPLTEVEAVVGELFDYLRRHHRGLVLLESCAVDRPELAELYFGRSRGGLLERLERWIVLRVEQGVFAAIPHPEAAVRLVVEGAAYLAWKRHGDRNPGEYDDDAARATTILFVSRALLSDASPERGTGA